jgi:hypothetical protein
MWILSSRANIVEPPIFGGSTLVLFLRSGYRGKYAIFSARFEPEIGTFADVNQPKLAVASLAWDPIITRSSTLWPKTSESCFVGLTPRACG